MFKPSAQDFLTPFGTLQRYTTLFDSFTDFSFHFYATLNFFSIMVRLTDVQRGRAIALLMQGQRQQQVANHFWVNVSTIERLVRRLRETGHLADRPRSGRPRVTSRRQDRTIRLAHLRNRHFTASALWPGGCGFDPRLGHTKDFKNGTSCSFAWRSALRK